MEHVETVRVGGGGVGLVGARAIGGREARGELTPLRERRVAVHVACALLAEFEARGARRVRVHHAELVGFLLVGLLQFTRHAWLRVEPGDARRVQHVHVDRLGVLADVRCARELHHVLRAVQIDRVGAHRWRAALDPLSDSLD